MRRIGADEHDAIAKRRCIQWVLSGGMTPAQVAQFMATDSDLGQRGQKLEEFIRDNEMPSWWTGTHHLTDSLSQVAKDTAALEQWVESISKLASDIPADQKEQIVIELIDTLSRQQRIIRRLESK
jgi:hypothetical protein